MPDQHVAAIPRDFFCEHTPSKSRVMALVDHESGPASLQAVLTCRDRELAHHAAVLLRQALKSATKSWQPERADALYSRLPDAPASSLRQAVSHALVGTWPVSAASFTVSPDQEQETAPDYLDEDEDTGHEEREKRTPYDARLRDLPGLVVQVTTLREFHVHDSDLLLKTARGAGWTPMSDDELPDEDPQDLVGAVMWLADQDGYFEGADTLTDQSSASFLNAEQGHELADWSSQPVVATFQSGWRLQASQDDQPEGEGELPDFAALFPVTEDHCKDDDCEECGWQLTPRTADLLHTALSVLADQAYDETEDLGDRPLTAENRSAWDIFASMPKLTYRCDLQWRRRMARALDDLVGDLEKGDWPEPTCTAEELALHLALREAPSYRDEVDDNDGHPHHQLPVHRDDYDYDACRDLFFQDTDVLMLYSARFDGIEDPDNDINRDLGIGDLRPAAWFEPFGNVEARDPRRGFRR
ncbi:hypothetical protein [Kitasatospora sp. NPDC059673]|uniref:hypothetical protein n=1 Tax=Kitasatospora sp. NPDC059673 TaxID=3346901 RepID=UPI003679461E